MIEYKPPFSLTAPTGKPVGAVSEEVYIYLVTITLE